MECKENNKCDYCKGSDSINRNIVECKGIRTSSAAVRAFSINRNIVECKEASVWPLIAHEQVLIETLWNVKAYANRIYKRYGLGINRNIVECKGISEHQAQH